jgi:hypothetical protein
MIQCDSDKPRCRKKAVVYLLLKGMKLPGAEESSMIACCAEHANDMLYGKRFLKTAGLSVVGAFIQGYGVLTENYRVMFITEEMHSDPGGES